MQQWEEAWTHQTEVYPAETEGCSVEVARRLFEKYREEIFQVEAPSLTTNKHVTCSHALPPYPAESANDGQRDDTNQYWATDTNKDKECWWQVDLEKPVPVGRIETVFYYGDKRSYGFTIETSIDGVEWDTVANYRKDHQPATREGVTTRFEPRPVRYIRVTLTHNSANTGRHVVEVLAFGD